MLTTYDLKKLALLGIIGGMAIGSPAFAEGDHGEKSNDPGKEVSDCIDGEDCPVDTTDEEMHDDAE